VKYCQPGTSCFVIQNRTSARDKIVCIRSRLFFCLLAYITFCVGALAQQTPLLVKESGVKIFDRPSQISDGWDDPDPYFREASYLRLYHVGEAAWFETGRRFGHASSSGELDPKDYLFPWPPPTPTCAYDIEASVLSGYGWKKMGDVNKTLTTQVLAERGDRAFYRVPHGFAIISRLETFQTSDPRYLTRLFGGAVERKRMFVHIVTNDVHHTQRIPMTESLAIDWLSHGMPSLEHDVAEQEYTKDHHIQALVYEFEQREYDKSPVFRHQSIFDRCVETHIIKTKLMAFAKN